MMKKKNIFNGKKIVFMAIGCLMLSACASDGHLVSIPEAIANKNWNGHPVYEAIAKWGKPLSVAHAGDGTTLYEWGWSPKYAYNEYAGSSYSSDGVQTDYFQRRIGTAECLLLINADSNGIITHLETRQAAAGCVDFYWGSNSASPDAATGVKGKMLGERIEKAKEINERYRVVCTKPEYAGLFAEMHCNDFANFTIASDVNLLKITPKQRELFSKWRAEMDSVVNAYLVFLRSTEIPTDKGVADTVDSVSVQKPVAEEYNMYLTNEHLTARNAQRLSAYVRRTYLQYEK
jgi:hypothetical protein